MASHLRRHFFVLILPSNYPCLVFLFALYPPRLTCLKREGGFMFSSALKNVTAKFKGASRALLGRPRKALTAAVATAAFVGISAVSAVATPFTISYENGTFSNLLFPIFGGSETATVTISADADTDDLGSSGRSDLEDWRNVIVAAQKSDGEVLTFSSGDAHVTVDGNGHPTEWYFSFSNAAGQTFTSSSGAGTDSILGNPASPFLFFSSAPGTLTLDPPPVVQPVANPELGTAFLVSAGVLFGAWRLRGRVGSSMPEPDGNTARARVDAQTKNVRRRANASNLDA